MFIIAGFCLLYIFYPDEFWWFFFKWRCKFYLSFRKKSIILPSPIHFVRLTPWTKFWLNLLRQTISIGPIYHLLRFLFFISLRTRGILTSKFATWLIIWCPMLEKYITNFSWLLFMHYCIPTITWEQQSMLQQDVKVSWYMISSRTILCFFGYKYFIHSKLWVILINFKNIIFART